MKTFLKQRPKENTTKSRIDGLKLLLNKNYYEGLSPLYFHKKTKCKKQNIS